MTEQSRIAGSVARTVRAERNSRGWSLDNLAARAGVSKGVLVALEQGNANPNLSTLIRISQALGVALTQLVQVEDDPPLRLLTADQQVSLWHGESGGIGTLIAGTEPRPAVELWQWTLHPGERRLSEAHTAGCREIVKVEEGVLTVTVDGRDHPVGTGDAAVFRGDLPHAYGNQGAAVTRFTLAVLDP